MQVTPQTHNLISTFENSAQSFEGMSNKGHAGSMDNNNSKKNYTDFAYERKKDCTKVSHSLTI